MSLLALHTSNATELPELQRASQCRQSFGHAARQAGPLKMLSKRAMHGIAMERS